MTGELIASLAGRVVGAVSQDRAGRLSFTHDEAWR
jgi:hypothetical protein